MSRLVGRSLTLTIALATLTADQMSKLIVVRSLLPGRAVPVIPGLFDLTMVTNAGGIFGLLRDAEGPLRGILFAAIPVVAIFLMGWYAWHLRDARPWPRAALGLIVGGAAGNLADRLRLGHVIDFLDAYIGTHHWPAFNLADSAICAGVALLLAEGVFSRETGDHAPLAGPGSP